MASKITRYITTGTGGFIGFHLARRLLDEGNLAVGFDGMIPYYDVALKKKAMQSFLGSQTWGRSAAFEVRSSSARCKLLKHLSHPRILLDQACYERCLELNIFPPPANATHYQRSAENPHAAEQPR